MQSLKKTVAIRCRSTTTWTKFYLILTPSPLRVDKRGHFTSPPPLFPRGQKRTKAKFKTKVTFKIKFRGFLTLCAKAIAC